MSTRTGKTRPLDKRPCETCGEPIFFALRVPLYAGGPAVWRAMDAAPVTGDLRAPAYVLVGTQVWRRVDLVEHWHVTKEISEDAARGLVDDYEHHLLHIHEREDDD